MIFRPNLAIATSVLFLAATAACRSEEQAQEANPKPIESAPSQPATPPQPEQRSDTDSQASDPDLAVMTVTVVDIDTRLAAMCGLDQSQVYFKFDSSQLRPEAKERLEKIVTCAREGAAKGQDLRVVGHTDPVGGDEFNKQLGMRRADAVAKYMQDQGLKSARVETASKGEMQAFPNPSRWPLDRRVVIRLGAPAPTDAK